MHELIKKFILENHLLTFSVADITTQLNAQSVQLQNLISTHTAHCFYAFDESNAALLIKSDPDSKHIKLALQNPIIALGISLNTQIVREIKGLQMCARFCTPSKKQQGIYHKRFPFAKLGGGQVYALEILSAKYTDNSLLTRQKIQFNRNYEKNNF